MIKVFQLDDYDWWAGESLEACIAAARQECGADTYEDAETDARELTAKEMQELKFTEDEGSTWCSFAEELERSIGAGDRFPRLLASTEW